MPFDPGHMVVGWSLEWWDDMEMAVVSWDPYTWVGFAVLDEDQTWQYASENGWTSVPASMSGEMERPPALLGKGLLLHISRWLEVPLPPRWPSWRELARILKRGRLPRIAPEQRSESVSFPYLAYLRFKGDLMAVPFTDGLHTYSLAPGGKRLAMVKTSYPQGDAPEALTYTLSVLDLTRVLPEAFD